MGKNNEETIITDLFSIRMQEENQPYLKFAELILKQIKMGKTKDEIIHKILETRGGLEADPREIKYFTDMVDIVFKWHNKNNSKEFQEAIKELLIEMDKNDKYLYIGKDGKNYATRADLDEANEIYVNQSYKNNSNRKI